MSVPNFFQFYCAVNSQSLKRLTYRMYIISDIKQGLPIFPSQICYSWANSLLDLLHQTFQTLASPTITLLNVKEQPANHFLHAHHPLQGTSWTNVLPLIGFSQSLLENSHAQFQGGCLTHGQPIHFLTNYQQDPLSLTLS